MAALIALGLVPIIIFVVVVLGIIALISAKRLYRNAGADEALIITGKRSKTITATDGTSSIQSGIKVVYGAGVFVKPFFEKVAKISLSSRAIEINVNAQDSNGVTIDVEAVALVKVGESEDNVRKAAQRFLGQEKKIDDFAREVLSGSLRSSIGATNVSTIIRKRDDLTASVLNVAQDALSSQGLDVDSFEVKSVTDKNSYLQDLGRAERAKVRLDAEKAEAQADQEAKEKRATADQAIAEAENTLALRKASLKLDADKAAAEAATAGPLASAKANQAVVEQEQQTAQLRAELRRAELESEVTAVAEANAKRTKLESEAAAAAEVARATADRDARVLNSEAVKAEGAADAAAIEARGVAEATATKAQAEALATQSEALLQLKVLEALPAIAREFAAPMGNIKNLTVVSTDGASALTKQTVGQFTELDGVLESTVGFKLSDVVRNVAAGRAAGEAHAATLAGTAAAPVAPANTEFPNPLLTDHGRAVEGAVGAVAAVVADIV